MENPKQRHIKATEAVRGLASYKNSSHSSVVFEESKNILKLDSNETSAPPSPKVIEALTRFINRSNLNWYPDVDSTKLREKLSAYTNFPADFIQTFNGSDNALECICRAYIEKGDEVVVCSPNYDHFRVYAESCGAKIVPIYGPTPFDTKPDSLINAVTDNTKIVYMSNPNNPTGLLYSEEEVRKILRSIDDSLVIVDEAYFEFCGSTMAPLVDCHSNLIISRSFSKTFGLAGLRCGYIIASPDIIGEVSKVRVGKNINSLAQVAAVAALDDIEYSMNYVKETLEGKKWIVEKISTLTEDVFDAPANFFLVRVADPEGVTSFLESRGVFIRDRSSVPHLRGFVRITAAPKNIMEKFWAIFKNVPTGLITGQS